MSEKRKKSWKEIDAQRDRSQHRQGEPKPGGGGKPGRDPSKSHRAALDQLFASGAVAELVKKRDAETGVEAEPEGPSRKALAEAITAAPDPKARQQALEAYLAAFGLPRDFEVLALLLDHTDPDVVGEALGRIDALLAEEQPKRPRTLIAQLKSVAELSEWGKLRRQAKAILEKL